MKEQPERRERMYPRRLALLGAGLGVFALLAANSDTIRQRIYPEREADTANSLEHNPERYPVHRNITTTIFWVGEAATDENKFIHNRSSAWVEDWESAYGGVDDPEKRCNHLPCGFAPRENPFYFALPYNDLDDEGNQKTSAKNIPWYTKDVSTESGSIVKNRWIKITHSNKTAYAQWEDVGPYGEEDFAYVFGSAKPAAPEAGLDVSPATASYLGIDGRDQASWQFVSQKDVPSGPWRDIITSY